MRHFSFEYCVYSPIKIPKSKKMKTNTFSRLAFALLLSSGLLLSCTSEEKKTTVTDTSVTTMQDTLPPLDTDSNTHTKPETMQNGNATKTNN